MNNFKPNFTTAKERSRKMRQTAEATAAFGDALEAFVAAYKDAMIEADKNHFRHHIGGSL